MPDAYEEALQRAKKELESIEQRRLVLLELINVLKDLSGDELYELTPPPGYVPEGLTAEVRKILTQTTVHLTPTQIRGALIARGFKHEPKNLLIAVHTVIGRIETELDVIQRDGRSVYRMKYQGLPLEPDFVASSSQLSSEPPTREEVNRRTVRRKI